MLTDAGNVEKVSDEQHVYNLKIFKRASKEKDGSMEEIMFVKGTCNYCIRVVEFVLQKIIICFKDSVPEV